MIYGLSHPESLTICNLILLVKSKLPGAMISTIEVDENNNLLFSSDSHGFIYVWNIDGYCIEGEESESPECRWS